VVEPNEVISPAPGRDLIAGKVPEQPQRIVQTIRVGDVVLVIE
jgi:hypothetical protein